MNKKRLVKSLKNYCGYLITLIGGVKSVIRSKLFWLVTFIIGHSFFMLLLTYVWLNQVIAQGNEESLVAKQALMQDYYFAAYSNDSLLLDELLLINVAYDKEFVEIVDELGVPSGKIDITDRRKLAQFIRILNETNQHKYVFCDIFLNPSFHSLSDSILAIELKRSKKLLIPAMQDGDSIINPSFDANSALSTYQNKVTSNQFFKYRFLQNGKNRTVPLKMWEEIDGGKIEKKGLFYFSNNKLCLNSLILNFPLRNIIKYNSNIENNYFELGTDILNDRTAEEVQNLARNKIVLIGDLVDRDLHATAFGDVPGVIITYNAYNMLKEGMHIIPKSMVIFLGMFFLFVNYFVLIKKHTFFSTIVQKIKLGKVAKVLIDLFSYVTVYTILSVLIYYFYHIQLNLLILAFYTAVFAFIVNYISKKQNESSVS